MDKPIITGIHHVAIKCNGEDEFKKTVDFYHNSLGLAIARKWGEGNDSAIMLDTGAGMLEIFADGSGNTPDGAVRHFALCVEDVDACIDIARNSGCTITMEATDIDIPSNPPYPVRVAFCIGFAGEELEFFHKR